MRLLFGREFQLREMLTLWDALFAAPEFSGMVEFISVAMLLYIRLLAVFDIGYAYLRFIMIIDIDLKSCCGLCGNQALYNFSGSQTNLYLF